MGMIPSIKVVTEERRVAGKMVSVAVVARQRPPSYVQVALLSVWRLLQGMRLTLGYFLSPETIVTRHYPENRGTLKITERFRGPAGAATGP